MLRLLRKRPTMLGRPEYLHRCTDVRQRMRLGNGALHHELSFAGQGDPCPDVIAEIDDLLQRARETTAGMSVDCMPRRADLHPLGPQRYRDRADVRHRVEPLPVLRTIAGVDADRATPV